MTSLTHTRWWPEFLNPDARLSCLKCGSDPVIDDPFHGCAICGVQAPLTMAFTATPRQPMSLAAATAEARRMFSVFAEPAAFIAPSVSTPLQAAPFAGPAVHLKHEAFSLTASHKDRYHAVVSTIAGRLCSPGVVASSTGNHGVSAAAHAASVGLQSVVFCHPHAPEGLLRAIGAFGGIAAQLDPAAQRAELTALVDAGWFPATTLDPVLSGAANPFGAEGYKAMAYEIVEQLNSIPKAVFVPTAGGDTYYGVAKGFAEIAALTGLPGPLLVAVQPEAANALTQSLTAGCQVTLNEPASIALSIADPQTGRHAMAVVEDWGGRAVDVSEAEIRQAIADLASAGIYTDPASAAALAGYRRAIDTGLLDREAVAVLVLTSSGFKWPAAMEQVFLAGSVKSGPELQARLGVELAPRGDGHKPCYPESCHLDEGEISSQ